MFSWSRYDVLIAINHPLAEQRAESREQRFRRQMDTYVNRNKLRLEIWF